MSKRIVQGRMLIDRAWVDDAILVCEDGKITYVGPKQDHTPDLIIEQGYLVPGFIDIHVHGAGGHDVMDTSEAAIRGVSRTLATYGVTSFLPTTLTAGIEQLVTVLDICRNYAAGEPEGAAVAGVHLEGPWINSKHKGAQNPAHLVAPTLEDAHNLVQAGGGLLKIVTLAPEQPDTHAVIEYLRDQGVKVSVGHSDATYEHVRTAMDHGLSHVTHCFNAMRGLHHREPGVVGAAMYHDELTAELIADCVHVHPVAMSILYRLKSMERLVLVSDGMRAVGMSDGEYDLGGMQVQMKDGEARLSDGTLAGSTLTLDRAVKNVVEHCQIPLIEALVMASETPARTIGVGDRKGRLAVNYDADFIVLDDELNVQSTFVGGKAVYEKNGTVLL